MGGNMIRFTAFDFVLGFILCRVMRITLEIEISAMHFYYSA